MISKKDAEGYLNQMLDIELSMKKTYKELSQKLKDESLKKQFLDMVNEEEDHANIVRDLKDLLNEYWRN